MTLKEINDRIGQCMIDGNVSGVQAMQAARKELMDARKAVRAAKRALRKVGLTLAPAHDLDLSEL